MIAVVIASSSFGSGIWIVVGLVVAALGLGALSTWTSAKRVLAAVVVALVLSVVLSQTARADGSYLICDNWWDYFPLCWIAFGG